MTAMSPTLENMVIVIFFMYQIIPVLYWKFCFFHQPSHLHWKFCCCPTSKSSILAVVVIYPKVRKKNVETWYRFLENQGKEAALHKFWGSTHWQERWRWGLQAGVYQRPSHEKAKRSRGSGRFEEQCQKRSYMRLSWLLWNWSTLPRQ